MGKNSNKVTIKSNVHTDDLQRKPSWAWQKREWNITHDEKHWVKDGVERHVLCITIHTRDQLALVADHLQRAADHEWCTVAATHDLNAYGASVSEPWSSPMHHLPAWEDIKPVDPVEAGIIRTLVGAARSVAMNTGCTVEESWGMVAGARRQPDWRLYPPTVS